MAIQSSLPLLPLYVNPSDTIKAPGSDLESDSDPYPYPTVIDIFRLAISRGDLAEIPQRIADALNTPTARPVAPELLLLLTASLSHLGLDSTLADDSLSADFTLSGCCARCSQPYREAENSPTACVVGHSPPSVQIGGITVDAQGQPLQARHYPCCGFCVIVHPSDPWSGVCYRAAHVLSLDEALQKAGTAVAFDSKQGVDESSAVNPTYHLQQASQAHSGFGPCSDIPVPRHGGINEGTTAAAPSTTDSSPAPTMSMSMFTASWAPAPAGYGYGLVAGAPNPYYHTSAQHFSNTLRVGAPGNALRKGSVPKQERPPVSAPKVIQTLPWKESSLYHPDGWIEVPSLMRRRGNVPPYV